MWIVRKERKRIKDLEDKVEKMPKEIESTCRDTINRRDADIYEKFEELKKQGTDRETRIINAIDNLGNRIDRLYEKH